MRQRRYLYRPIDQFGQAVDVFLSTKRQEPLVGPSPKRWRAQTPRQLRVVTDRAPAYLCILDASSPRCSHDLDHYSHNVLEADHGRLKARLRPMRGVKTEASIQLVARGHAFVQNLPHGHDELAVAVRAKLRLAHASAELAPFSDGSG